MRTYINKIIHASFIICQWNSPYYNINCAKSRVPKIIFENSTRNITTKKWNTEKHGLKMVDAAYYNNWYQMMHSWKFTLKLTIFVKNFFKFNLNHNLLVFSITSQCLNANFNKRFLDRIIELVFLIIKRTHVARNCWNRSVNCVCLSTESVLFSVLYLKAQCFWKTHQHVYNKNGETWIFSVRWCDAFVSFIHVCKLCEQRRRL